MKSRSPGRLFFCPRACFRYDPGMNGLHRLKSFRVYHLAFWVVAGVGLFISGYSQSGSVAIAATRNVYLTLFGLLISYALLVLWQRIKNQKTRQAWYLFLAAAYLLGMIIVIPINPVTYGQLGLSFDDLTWNHIFAGTMNFGFVMMFWGVCLMFLFKTGFRLPGAARTTLVQPGVLEVETRDGTAAIPLSKITHLKAAADYAEVHTLDGKDYLKRATIKSLLGMLEEQGFVQVHRSLVVNLKALKSVEGQSKGAYTLVMKNGVRLKTSRRYKTAVEALLP